MNLATARSVKEPKKLDCANHLAATGQIAKQFFLESFLMILGSLLMAVLLVILFLHPFNQLAHKSFTLGSLVNPVMITIIGGIVLFMGFISGIYPAFYLSAFQPVEVLKGQIVKGKGAEFFRKSLVTVQYTVALILIVCTFIVIRQMDQLKTTKLNDKAARYYLFDLAA
jgi:putative ABC transport system permease protein